MKQLLIATGLCVSILFTGCLDLTQELTISEDGSGELSGKMDMSEVMAMITQMGGGSEKDKLAIDSAVLFSSFLDSAKDLSPDEKALLKDAVLNIKINTEEGKCLLDTKVPFKKISDIDRINLVMQKYNSVAMDKAISKATGENPAGTDQANGKDNPFGSMPENYFELKCSEGKISRTLKKEKYAKIGEDSTLAKMKEGAEMGGTINSTFIINLPGPVKKFTGKNVKLSDDKKKITVVNTLDELFDDASKYEFTIEY
ncbi:MAG: hypothetical protein EPN92_08290 [Chitinophagaceae bacterium]|nr:MAG: hypothetical protein EPN92_08290 [Chitinophagaceae bacterium]